MSEQKPMENDTPAIHIWIVKQAIQEYVGRAPKNGTRL